MVYSRCKKVSGSLLLVLTTALTFGVSGCGKQESAKTLLTEARAYHQKGDNKSAIIQLKQTLQDDPANGEARYLLGTIYNETGDFRSAEKELRRALESGVEKSRVQVALGRALLKQGEFQKVLDEIPPASEGKGEAVVGILTLRANAYIALGKIDNAKSAVQAVLRQQPDYAEAYLAQARIALVEKNVEEAVRQLNAALEKAPQSIDGWLMKGDVLRLQAKPEEAMAAYQQVLKIDPNNVAAHLDLASMRIATNKLEDARKETDAARKERPNNLQARYLAALLDFRQSKFAEARDELQLVLRSEPNHMPSVLLSGATAYALGSYEQAESDLNKFLHQFPSSIYARKLLAATLLRKGQAERAFDILKPILTKDTRDPPLLVLAGEICMAMKSYDKATGYLEKAVALDPKNAAMRTVLGVSQLAEGDTERAIAAMESASALDPGQYKADTMLVQIYLRSKQYDKAMTAIATLEKKQPNNPQTYNLKGGAYLGKGDVTNARKCFERALALQPTYIDAAMNLAQLDIKDRHPDAANKRMENILEKDKNNVVAMLALADFAAKSGREQDYVSWLEKAAKASPTALQPPSLLANYYVQKKQPEKALVLAQQAQTANPNSPEALDLLGLVQSAAGEKDNAVETYGKLATLAPKSPQAQYKLAVAQAAKQNLDAAEASLQKALVLQPDYLDAEVALISLDMKADKGMDGLKIAHQIQQQHPKMSLGFTLEGEVFTAQKQYNQATEAYGKAFNIEKSGLTAIKLHQAQTLAGNVKDADSLLLQWLKDHPDDAAVRTYMAQVYMKQGQNKQAIAQYGLVLQKDPANLFALNNLAWLYYNEKDPRALETAEQAYKLRPEAAFIADTLGWILLEQGRTARGVEILQKATSLAPNNPEIGYHYAVALFKSGDKQKARKQLDTVLDSGKSFPQQEEAMALQKQL